MSTQREIKKTEEKIAQLQQKLTDLHTKLEKEEKEKYEGEYAVLHDGETDKFVIDLIVEYKVDEHYPFITEYSYFRHAVLLDENISLKDLVEKLKSL